MSGQVDEVLRRKGRAREVVVATPHFMVGPLLVADTDYVITLPRRVGEMLAPLLGLRLLEPPMELAGFAISQLWHGRSHHDPALRWLRGEVVGCCAEQ